MTDSSEPRSWFGRIFGSGPQNGEAKPETGASQGAGQQSRNLSIDADALERLRVADVMVPRADIIGVEVDTPLSQLTRAFADASHSRLPIYRETLDDPVGVAHIKDVIGYLAEDGADETGLGVKAWGERLILRDIARPLLFAPPSMRAAELLLRMQSRRRHMALVVDEYGGTDGLVTLEDLIEPVVGNIEDEHDEDEAPEIMPRTAGVWEVEARVSIDDFEEVAGQQIATPDEDEEVDTLGGLVFTLAGRIPERGEVIPHPSGYEFEVLDADPRRIKRMCVRAADKSKPDG